MPNVSSSYRGVLEKKNVVRRGDGAALCELIVSINRKLDFKPRIGFCAVAFVLALHLPTDDDVNDNFV